MLERTADGKIRWRVTDHHEERETNGENWLAVWSPTGQLLYRQASFEDGGRELFFSSVPLQQHGYASVALPGDVHLRILTESYTIEGIPVVIRVARSEAQLRHELNELLLVLGFGFPVAVGVAGSRWLCSGEAGSGAGEPDG